MWFDPMFPGIASALLQGYCPQAEDYLSVFNCAFLYMINEAFTYEWLNANYATLH